MFECAPHSPQVGVVQQKATGKWCVRTVKGKTKSGSFDAWHFENFWSSEVGFSIQYYTTDINCWLMYDVFFFFNVGDCFIYIDYYCCNIYQYIIHDWFLFLLLTLWTFVFYICPQDLEIQAALDVRTQQLDSGGRTEVQLAGDSPGETVGRCWIHLVGHKMNESFKHFFHFLHSLIVYLFFLFRSDLPRQFERLIFSIYFCWRDWAEVFRCKKVFTEFYYTCFSEN